MVGGEYRAAAVSGSCGLVGSYHIEPALVLMHLGRPLVFNEIGGNRNAVLRLSESGGEVVLKAVHDRPAGYVYIIDSVVMKHERVTCRNRAVFRVTIESLFERTGRFSVQFRFVMVELRFPIIFALNFRRAGLIVCCFSAALMLTVL